MMERISYKIITIILLVMLAFLGIVHTLIAKQQFHDAALRSQAASLSRVIEVASDQTLKQLHKESLSLANVFQERLFDDQTKQLLAAESMHSKLDELFSKKLADTSDLALVKLRVYDTDLKLLAESSGGAQDLPDMAPRFIQQRVLARRGVGPHGAIGGMWQSPGRPLYSLLLPLYGLHQSGYLEVVTDPLPNLGDVSATTKLPIRITTIAGQTLFSSPSLPGTDQGRLLPVEYLLRDEEEQPLFQITAYDDTRSFQSDLQATQFSSTVTFIIIMLAVLLLVHFLFNHLLFRPIGTLIDGMQQCMEGDLDAAINEQGVKEVHLIAHAFNIMAQTQRANMNELRRLSSLDGLTGIANRRTFDLMMDHEWTRAMRNRTPLAVLIIDIDNFKAFNDSQGHQAGDRCLCEVAELLQKEMKRPGDTVARYGGEEFAVVLPDTDIFGAGVVALNIRNTLQSRAIPHPASDIAVNVTLSIGINVVVPGLADTIQAFIDGADRALYEVKRSGRNNICFANNVAKDPRSGTVTASAGISH